MNNPYLLQRFPSQSQSQSQSISQSLLSPEETLKSWIRQKCLPQNETIVRQFVDSVIRTATTLPSSSSYSGPSTASTQTKTVQWNEDLAVGFATLVLSELKSKMQQQQQQQQQRHAMEPAIASSSNNTLGRDPSSMSSSSLSSTQSTTLHLAFYALATLMGSSCWSDEWIYAVLNIRLDGKGMIMTIQEVEDKDKDEEAMITTTTTTTEAAEAAETNHLLSMLMAWSIGTNDNDRSKSHPMKDIALITLSNAIQAMDRLHQHLTLDYDRPDVGWWTIRWTEQNINDLSMLVNGIIISNQRCESPSPSNDNISSILPIPDDQLYYAAASILCHILRREALALHAVGIHEETIGYEINRICRLRIQTLISPQSPPSVSAWHVPCALISSSLIELLLWRTTHQDPAYENLIQSTTFMENVLMLANFRCSKETQQFNISSNWIATVQYDMRFFEKDSFYLIRTWALTKKTAWSIFLKLDRHWQPYLKTFWETMIHRQEGDATIQNQNQDISKVLLLHHSARLVARGILYSVLQDDISNATNTLIGSFIKSLSNTSNTNMSTQLHYMRLIRLLFSDRQSLSTHDEISRAFWSNISSEFAEHLLSFVVDLKVTQDSTKPLLLATLDVLDTLLQDQENCDLFFKSITAERMERLIYVLDPKNVKFDFKSNTTAWNDLSLDLDLETPPANNLSRLDDASICLEQESTLPPKGFDDTVCLACATMLSRLGYSYTSMSQEDVYVLKSRICAAVNDYVSDFLVRTQSSSYLLSFDMSKRSLRLQLAVGTLENEDFLATTLHSAHLLQHNSALRSEHRQREIQSKLLQVQQRQKQLERNVSDLMDKNKTQSYIFKRETSRLIENATHNAKQLVAIHTTERSIAEGHAHEYKMRLDQIDDELKRSRLEVENSQKVVQETKRDLQNALDTRSELEQKNQLLTQKINIEETRTKDLENEMVLQSEKIATLLHSRQTLESEVDACNQSLQDCKMTNQTLQQNLEDLFADLVNLAVVHESLEGKMITIQQQHHDEIEHSQKKLQKEQDRIDALQISHDELEETNKKLWKKLEKYKERLEEERKSRSDEAASRKKRNGPVSYINQLHQSTSMSTSDTSVRKGDYAASRSRRYDEKENMSNTSRTSSHRRKNYY